MSVIDAVELMMGGSDPLDELGKIARSVRLRRSALGNLTRAFVGTPYTYTFGVWVRRGLLGAEQYLTGSRPASGSVSTFGYSTADKVTLKLNDSVVVAATSDTKRDLHGWSLLLLSVTQSGLANIYSDDGLIGSAAVGATPFLFTNAGGYVNAIGQYGSVTSFNFEGGIAYPFFVDGKALTPASFGRRHPLTKQFRPITPSAMRAAVAVGGGARNGWGADGFFLPLDDATSLTTIGYDRSQSDTDTTGNNWTASNISLTAGATYDSLLDTPTNTFCTLNSLVSYSTAPTFSDGNLSFMGGVAAFPTVFGTLPMASGVFWAEYRMNTVNTTVGIAKANAAPNNFVGVDPNGWAYASTGLRLNNNVTAAYGAPWTSADTIGIKFNADAGTVEFFKQTNSTGAFVSQGVAYTGLTSGPYYFAAGDGASGSSEGGTFNFGQRAFNNSSLPGGAVALCAKNLRRPTGAALKPWEHIDIDLFSGDGAARNRGGFAFGPGLLWLKARNATRSHRMFSRLRGVGNRLEPNLTNAQAFDAQTLTAFNSDGYSLGTSAETNAVGESIVAWLFRDGGAPVANNAGSIASQVSVNAAGGMSLVSWNGNGLAAATVGHGLPQAPGFVIYRSVTAAKDWYVWHKGLPAGYQLRFTTAAKEQISGATTDGGIATPTSNVLGFLSGTSNVNGVNQNGVTYEAICFAEIPDYSAMFDYLGQGAAGLPFVPLTFRPRFILLTREDAVSDWWLVDTARDPSNVVDNVLYPDLTAAEAIYPFFDLVNGGIKCRDPAHVNVSGGRYIGIAISEAPIRYSNAR